MSVQAFAELHVRKRVSTALFKAAFTSLVRLAGSDERRLALLNRVLDRAYEELNLS